MYSLHHPSDQLYTQRYKAYPNPDDPSPHTSCVISVSNQHIFLTKNARGICENAKFYDSFITFCQIFIFQDFFQAWISFFRFP